jgi:hypothetical protein
MERLRQNNNLYKSLVKESKGDYELLANLVKENRINNNGYIELMSLIWSIRKAVNAKKTNSKTS